MIRSGTAISVNVRSIMAMWTSTRMIVLAAVVAAMYATAQIVLAPFAIVLVPGVLQFKLSNIFTMLFGVLLGPAGAWGVGIGNTIGDFFTGNLALGSVFGFLSSFSVGFTGYTLWRSFATPPGQMSSASTRAYKIAVYLAIGVIAAAVSAVILAWGLDLLGIAPFALVSNTLVANFVVGNWLGGLLYAVLHPRLRAMGLTWPEIMEHDEVDQPLRPRLGALLLTVGGLGGWVLGAFVLGSAALIPGVGVFVLCILAGALLL